MGLFNLKIKKIQRGINLVELMIVIVITGIMLGIALPAYSNYSARSKLAGIIPIIGQLTQDINSFYSENGRLPISGDSLMLLKVSTPNDVFTTVSWGIINTLDWSADNGSCAGKAYVWLFLGIDTTKISLTSVSTPGIHLLARVVTGDPVNNFVVVTCGPWNSSIMASADFGKLPKNCNNYSGTFFSGCQ